MNAVLRQSAFLVFSFLLLPSLSGAVVEMREGAFTVKPNPCPGCPMRMRFTPDGKTAFVNTSRVNEKDFPAEARRAFDLMKKGADAAKVGRCAGALLNACDVQNLPETTYELVTNPFLLMMNQNDLAAQPKVVQRKGEAYAIVKDADETFGKGRYLALYNAEDTAQDFDVPFEELGLYGKVRVFDLGERADLEIQQTHLFVNVPAHDAKFFRLDAEKRARQPRKVK